MNREALYELLYHALESEQSGERIYETALRCAVNLDLLGQWGASLEQTRNHIKVLFGILSAMGLDSATLTSGRQILRVKTQCRLDAMEQALKEDKRETAQVVASECIIQVETDERQNWDLLGEASKHLNGREGSMLREACEKMNVEENRHLYNARGWTRELWLQALGLPAVLPPPEERKRAAAPIAAARAKRLRGKILRRPGPPISGRVRRAAHRSAAACRSDTSRSRT